MSRSPSLVIITEIGGFKWTIRMLVLQGDRLFFLGHTRKSSYFIPVQIMNKQPKPKRKLQRATVQLITREPDPPQADLTSSLPPLASIQSARGSTTSTATLVPAAHASHSVPEAPVPMPLPLPPANEPMISANSPLRLLPSYQRRIISPSASPLKSRQDDAFGSVNLMRGNTGVSGASSNHPGGNKKKEAVPVTAASKHEKENIRSTLKDARR